MASRKGNGEETSRSLQTQIEAPRPQAYQELVKSKEFIDFLYKQGVTNIEEQVGNMARRGDIHDSRAVKGLLHDGARLLISNSKHHVADRRKLEKLFISQAAFFLAAELEEVEAKGQEIEVLLQEFKETFKGKAESGENLEIDIYTHAWVNDGKLKAVMESVSNNMGIVREIHPMNLGTPEGRPIISTSKPQKTTPCAKNDCNIINIGEVASNSDGCIPKKIAQLERACTYVALRSGNQNIEEVVGYGALCMSEINGSSIAKTIINLHPDKFPCLAKLQKKGGIAYLSSRRTLFEDIERIGEELAIVGAKIEARIQKMEARMVMGGLAIVGLALATSAWVSFRRFYVDWVASDQAFACWRERLLLKKELHICFISS